MRHDHPLPPDIEEFLAALRRQEAAPATVRNYGADLRAFARWFGDSTGEVFTAAAVTPTDIRAYKAYLRTVARQQAATVNRRLAALRRFFVWAKGAGRIAATY
jgi:integrase/recombinase XerD